MWRLLPGKVQGAKCVQRRRREHSGDGLRRGRPHGLHPQPTRLREDGASQLRAGAVQVRRGGGGVQEDPLPLRRLQHRLQSQGAQQVPRLPGRRPPLPSRPVRRHSGRHLAGGLQAMERDEEGVRCRFRRGYPTKGPTQSEVPAGEQRGNDLGGVQDCHSRGVEGWSYLS
ncbi:unnamed protein product [Linum tenue]|uniref:Uncharacterized protein n=1 Tax=Linum tenue TaxID=586396 RepID=A0AAV0Q3R7_9ROSI|nr:unnamed protein product [Linum tenue]